jgi:hypothetical protein
MGRTPNATAWTEAENLKLRNFAGKLSPEDISKELGRSAGAIVVQASKLGISLRTSILKKTMRGPNEEVKPQDI